MDIFYIEIALIIIGFIIFFMSNKKSWGLYNSRKYFSTNSIAYMYFKKNTDGKNFLFATIVLLIFNIMNFKSLMLTSNPEVLNNINYEKIKGILAIIIILGLYLYFWKLYCFYMFFKKEKSIAIFFKDKIENAFYYNTFDSDEFIFIDPKKYGIIENQCIYEKSDKNQRKPIISYLKTDKIKIE